MAGARKQAAIKQQEAQASMPYEVLIERMPGQFKSMCPRRTFNTEIAALVFALGLRSGLRKSYAVKTITTGKLFPLLKEYTT